MKGRDGEVKGFRVATGPSRVELQVKTQDDSICHNFRENDSDAGRDDSPRFGFPPRTTSPDIKCLTSQTRPFWFRAIPSGRDTGPHECDIANHDAKITLCICGYLSLCRASLPPYFHVHVHQSVSSLTADQNIHSAWGTFCNFDFFFFFLALAHSQATDCCCRWSCASQMEQHHFLRSLTGSIQELIRSQSIKPC